MTDDEILISLESISLLITNEEAVPLSSASGAKLPEDLSS